MVEPIACAVCNPLTVSGGRASVGGFRPSPINGIVMDKYVSLDPFGPVIDDQDTIVTAVEEAYARAGINVTFVDDYFSHQR